MNCVLIGNYGVANFGDEILRDFFVDTFPNKQWHVVTSHGKNRTLPRLPFGFRSLFLPWYKTVWALYTADAVVFGGGTLWTDIESIKACFIWSLHAFVAFLFRKPVYLTFQGIGPWRTAFGKWLTKKVCERAQYISVRDIESYNRIQGFTLQCAPVLTFDPIIVTAAHAVIANTHSAALVLIPRHNSAESFLKATADALQKEPGMPISILSFQPNNTQEKAFTNTLQQLYPQATITIITNLEAAVACMKCATKVISQRFHGSLIAYALNVPVQIVTQQKNDKHSALQTEMENIFDCKQRAASGIESLKTALLRDSTFVQLD